MQYETVIVQVFARLMPKNRHFKSSKFFERVHRSNYHVGSIMFWMVKAI